MTEKRQNKLILAMEVHKVNIFTDFLRCVLGRFSTHNGKNRHFFHFDDDFLVNYMNLRELRESRALFCPVEKKQPRRLCELCVNF